MALARGKRIRSGLDDGSADKEKKKVTNIPAKAAGVEAAVKINAGAGAGVGGRLAASAMSAVVLPSAHNATAMPTIRPGERMSNFAARVDAALPVSGLIQRSGKHNKDPLGFEKVFRTKQERKLHKLYDQWRLEDAKRKDRLVEEQELAELDGMELDESLGVKWRLDFQQQTGTKKKKKKGAASFSLASGDDGGNYDMWAAFNRKNGNTNTIRTGTQSAVTAPPEFHKIDSKKFKFTQKAENRSHTAL
ncbi:hypothetical protein SPI_09466 [Niveomyces insectorum RCEF 264]|uniref:Uncharacterized protein n=1 Tax=Niveomyces insectorum RCEF 264 TaxID=1081102 RepID=A0A162MAD6_9HYPO|nr:hypothetical protein SPI_09466 [Niveomyces insectorum RCEF 264]